MTRQAYAWIAFALAGLLIFLGGPRHPGGSMQEMLADPAWVPSHLLILFALLVLLLGILLATRDQDLPRSVVWWRRAAIIGVLLEVVELVFHTAAVVDQANLAAGRSTPVLDIHLALAVVCYPAFGFAMAGFIIAGAKARLLGWRWSAPLGVIGVVAFGIAAPLAILAPQLNAGFLFPLLILFAVWLLITAGWGLIAERRALKRAAA